MSYGLYPELFEETEKDIERGLYEQAEDRLKNLKKTSLSKEHAQFARLLAADIYSRQGKFTQALELQRSILAKPPSSLLLKEAAFHSHAYTLGYTGNHEAAYEYFGKAQSLSKKLKNTYRYYASVIGSIDIEFHDYSCNRFYPQDNECLLARIDAALRKIKALKDFKHKDAYAGMFCFRKAVLLWLNESYAEAKPLFELARQSSKTFFSIWALFGIVNCLHKLGDRTELQKYAQELAAAETKPACKKNAMKYWPVALLLGRTWELLGHSRKAHDFYRTILLIARNGYTNQKVVSPQYCSFITNYFYPVYQETVRHFIEVSHEYRYAINRAEMFRARFLTEEYKRHYSRQHLDSVLSPNTRIDAIGRQLAAVFANEVTILYCFDFNDSGVLLLSKNPGGNYRRFSVQPEEYTALKRLTVLSRLTKGALKTASAMLKNLLTAVKTKKLIVIPHGMFNSIPFHALMRGTEPLLSRTLVNYWPSLHMAALGETGKRCIPRSLLCIGTRSDAASETEIQQLAEIAGSSRSLYDPLLPGLKKALQASAGITHFVTHGKIRSADNDLTVLKFRWGDFQLSHLSAELTAISPVVALNVCFGGHMIQDSVESIKGLPVTLFQKGALALIVPCCAVEQGPSRMFYKRFYTNLFNGLTLGKAYRKAILEADDIECMLANAPRLMGTGDLTVA